MKELECVLPFELFSACPTISFQAGAASMMLPYSSLEWARLAEDKIHIRFQDWKVTVEGRGLMRIWKELQCQNVREINCSPSGGDESEIYVDAIAIEAVGLEKNSS